MLRAGVLGWRSCNPAFIGLGIKNSGKGKRLGKNRCFPNGCYYLSPLSRAGFADLLGGGSGETSPQGPSHAEEVAHVGSEGNGLMWGIFRKIG